MSLNIPAPNGEGAGGRGQGEGLSQEESKSFVNFNGFFCYLYDLLKLVTTYDSFRIVQGNR